MATEDKSFFGINGNTGFIPVLRLLALSYPGGIRVIRISIDKIRCLLFFSILRHNLNDHSGSPGRLHDGRIQYGTIRFFNENPFRFELMVDLCKKRFLKVQLKKGISEPADRAVIRQGAFHRKTTESNERGPVVDCFF